MHVVQASIKIDDKKKKEFGDQMWSAISKTRGTVCANKLVCQEVGYMWLQPLINMDLLCRYHPRMPAPVHPLIVL